MGTSRVRFARDRLHTAGPLLTSEAASLPAASDWTQSFQLGELAVRCSHQLPVGICCTQRLRHVREGSVALAGGARRAHRSGGSTSRHNGSTLTGGPVCVAAGFGRSCWTIRAQGRRDSRPIHLLLQLSILVTHAEESSLGLPCNDAIRLLKAIARLRALDFSGIGVVFYEDLAQLPHLQLTNDEQKPTVAGLTGGDLATQLAGISVMSSPLHDGFHFVDVRCWQLTHIAQFISPPIPRDVDQRISGTGARLMAAALTSLLPGISCVGLTSQTGEVHLFRGGVDVAKRE